MYEAHVLLLYGFAPFVRLLHPGRKLKVKSASAQGGKLMRQLLILVALLQPIVAPAQRSDAENPPEVSDQATLSSVSMLQSFNYPDHFVSHHDNLGNITITNNRSVLTRGDANFRLVPGLADPSKVSFESVKRPGLYLRHQGWRVKLHKFDGTQLFREDATFKRVPGLADASWESFESQNYPGKFLRHRNFHLWVEGGEGELFRKDATFLPVLPPSLAQATDKEAGRVVDHQELRSGSGGVVYLAGSDEPYTGLVRDFYPNGQRESESSYVDGKQDGIDTEWYDDGQKKAERTWALGQRVHEILWWENGQKRHESKYVDGKLHGGTSWFEDGNKRKEDVWVGGQKKSRTEWHENGNKKSEEFYVAGKKDGQFTAWYENGQMQAQVPFSEGAPHGNVTTWDPEGRKRLVENYVHGKKDGVRIEWHENGQMRTEELYRAGQRKVLKRWDVHGNILMSWPEENAQDDTSTNDNAVRMEQLKKRGGRFYEKGSDAPYSGAVKDYYPNGNKKSSLTLVDGKPVGRQFMWHASGTIEGEAEFDTDGTGYGKEWYEDGQ